jgi:hypothetical protein
LFDTFVDTGETDADADVLDIARAVLGSRWQLALDRAGRGLLRCADRWLRDKDLSQRFGDRSP